MMNRRSRGGRDEFFDFGNRFASFGGFPGQRSLIPDFFGGRDPFDDDHFLRNPFGSMFESSVFGGPGIPFANMHASGFIDHQVQVPESTRPRGLIIEEISSDDDDAEKDPKNLMNLSKEPLAPGPHDEEKRIKHLQLMDHHSGPNQRYVKPQANSFTFQSSSVTYGSSNGAYYTSSTTRRSGSDGVVFEESKEANTATRQASHRVSRGLHNKGHSVTRKLNPDGKVDTMQTLHNLNGDELESFETAWARNSRSLSGMRESSNSFNNIGGGIGQNGQSNRVGWALPFTEQGGTVKGRSNQQVNRSRKNNTRYRSA